LKRFRITTIRSPPRAKLAARCVNRGTLPKFEIHLNLILFFSSQLVGIGAEDLRDGVLHLVFGLLWQIIKQGLLSKINIAEHPELLELGLDQSELEKLSASHPEELLLRWVNFHLRNAGSARVMTNFTQDVQDSEIYTTLLHHLAPNECSMDILQKKDLHERASALLEAAELLDVRKFVSPGDIVAGNYKLNMAFVANLFDKAAQFERSAALARNEQLAKAAQDAAALAAQTAAAEARAKAAEDAARAAERAAKEQAAAAAARAAEAEKRRAALEQEAKEREAHAHEERQRLERQSSQRAAELAANAKKREDELKAQLAGLEDAKAEAMRRALREREELEKERNKLLERLEASRIDGEALRQQSAALAAQLAQLEKAMEEAQKAREAAEQSKSEEIAKTKAGARDWFAKQDAEKAKAIAAANAAAEAWQKKATDKEALLKKYQDALKQAREQRDQAKDELEKATNNADAHHKAQLAEKDKQLEDMRQAALAMQARYEESLEAVRARAASSTSNAEVETLKRQAMEALQHVQAQGASQLEAQKRAYDAELARLRKALADAEAAAQAAAPNSAGDDDGKAAKKRLRTLEKRLAAAGGARRPAPGIFGQVRRNEQDVEQAHVPPGAKRAGLLPRGRRGGRPHRHGRGDDRERAEARHRVGHVGDDARRQQADGVRVYCGGARQADATMRHRRPGRAGVDSRDHRGRQGVEGD
jgi:hypothetical protein